MTDLPIWADLPQNVREAISSIPAGELTGTAVYACLRDSLVVAGAGTQDLDWQPDGDELFSTSSVGRFHLLPLDGVFMVFLDGIGQGGHHATMDEAKAVAQAEFQRRAILKAIENCRSPGTAVGYVSEIDLDRLAKQPASEPEATIEIHRLSSPKAPVPLYRAAAGMLENCIRIALDETYLVEDDPDEPDHDQAIRVRTAKRIASNLRHLGSAPEPLPDLTAAQRSTLREMASYAPHVYVFRQATCRELVTLGLAVVVQPSTGRTLKRPPHRITDRGKEVLARSKK